MSQATVHFFLPAPALRHAVSTYYVLHIAGPDDVEDMFPPEWANIRLVLSGRWRVKILGQSVQPVAEATISGTQERGLVAYGTPGIGMGIGILPEGWVQLTGQPADAFANRLRPLSDAFGPHAGDLVPMLRALADGDGVVEALDRYLLDRLAPRPMAPTIVREAHAALVDAGNRSVEDWATCLTLSTRQLERLCLRYFGLRPMRLLRRQRFLRSLAAIRDVPPGSWGTLIDPHYVDQSHFIREFRYFLGMSPRRYFARPQPFMRQAGDRRKALLGSPVQGLHAPAATDDGSSDVVGRTV
ncbi:helix-turn-helix domain-containing protein [Reyranella sp. CPCC 100927]|uniref:helix-turn-helix domain-containing protein n=1 Tax=Reyranella sp. CPCC 100927 TaxID=2599616 RepID=UPI0011B52A6C|nr:helix-turn-helix domain-containing protein [Reyranella sp. CPCC 100927]TWT10834.1 AraC family transcriptional regulator [Reyranella sp. CPCC 100927]